MQEPPEKGRIDFSPFWLEYDEYLLDGIVVVTAYKIVHSHHGEHPYRSMRALRVLLRLLLYDTFLCEDYMTVYFSIKTPGYLTRKGLFHLGFRPIPRKDYPREYLSPRKANGIWYYKTQVSGFKIQTGFATCANQYLGRVSDPDFKWYVLCCPKCQGEMYTQANPKDNRFYCTCGYSERRKKEYMKNVPY